MVMIIGIFAEKKVPTLPKNSKKLLPHKNNLYEQMIIKNIVVLVI